MANRNALAPNVPTIFCTTARKVEPMGSDCVRVYLCVEKDGGWQDRGIVEMPITGLLKSSEFVTRSVLEIAAEAEGQGEKMLAH